MSLPAWRACLRIARRDALRSRARSLLVVAMIALPVLGVSMADVLARSAQLSPTESLSRTQGTADVRLSDTRTRRIDQLPDGSSWQQSPGLGQRWSRPALDLRSVLPPGSRGIPLREGSVRVRTAGRGIARVDVLALAYDDPIARGIVAQVRGRAPRTGSEVALTPQLAARAGVTVGGTLTVTDPLGRSPDRGYTVVGLARRHDGSGDRVFARPGALALRDAGPDSALLVRTPSLVSWNGVRTLNDRGVLAVSRAVVLDPPPRAAQPASLRAGQGSGQRGQRLALVLLAAGMALLEVVLLAGPAFAVGTRRQSRQLALLGAVGGDGRHIRDSVLAGGVVLGGAGALVGAAIGVGLAAAMLPFAQRITGSDPGSVDLRALELGGTALVGLLTGVAAAVLPARNAARQDVWAALAGRRGTVRTPGRVPVLGLAATAAGTAVALAGAGRSSPALLLGGCALAEIGLVACTPTLVAAVARAGRWLPAAPRMALRDAARHRTRSGPAVSAILAAVAGSVAVALYFASSAGQAERTYQPELPRGDAYIGLWDPALTAAAPRIAGQVAAALPLRRSYDVRTLDSQPPVRGVTGLVEVKRPHANACPADPTTASSKAALAAAHADRRCQQFMYSSPFSTPVGDAALFTALTGSADPAARRVLAAGGVVALDPLLVDHGTAVLQVTGTDEQQPDAPARVLRSVRVPAVAVRDATFRPGPAFFSPAAARALGARTSVAGVLLATTRMPTQSEQDRGSAVLAANGIDQTLMVERGYRSSNTLGLLGLALAAAIVTLGAAGIATGLAAADGRPDLATLAAVGASPAVRRRLAMAQAATVAGLGTALGVLAGFVPGYAAVRTRNAPIPLPGGGWTYGSGGHMTLVVPWPTLLLVAVAVPLLAVLAAGALTRSRLPLVRRLE